MGSLTLCGAGAGTGKTYSICEWIAHHVEHEDLDPARLIATTFTIKAAAELKARIAERLLEAGMSTARAARLELAPIGTVHAVAYQLLTRYALHLGLSPRLRVADEVQAERLLKLAIQRTQTQAWDRLAEVATRLAQDDLELTLLLLIEEKRTNDLSDDIFRAEMRRNAGRFREILQGIVPVDDAGPSNIFTQVKSAAGVTLEQLSQSSCTTKATREARTFLREVARGAHLTWRDLVRLSRIKAGKRSGADALLNEIRDLAASVRVRPELHRDIDEFAELMAEQTIALEHAYQTYKTERGLLDFTDLEVELLRLLRSDLVEDVQAEFDMLIVDEFQDTNPLQLAIFARLREVMQQSYWVGDPKQSIFGFRGTDSRLMESVWEQAKDAEHRALETNYRSQGGLVQLVNRLFEPQFGTDAVLAAEHESSEDGIRRWVLDVSTNAGEARALSQGIEQLHRDGTAYSEIAVLVRTNNQGRDLGAALAERGIPSIIELPGLLEYRECVLALAGLRVVADRRDALAAATVVHLLTPQEGTPDWLQDRLRDLREQALTEQRRLPWQGHPVLEALHGVSAEAGCRTPTENLAAVVSALELPTRVAQWTIPGLRASHLDALWVHARDYERQTRDTGRPTTLTGLITYLEQLGADNQDLRPAQSGLEAVTVATYHAAKGLEWPTVILTGLDHARGPDLYRPATSGGDPTSGNPLAERRLHYWPWPFGKNRFESRTRGSRLADDCYASPEGQRAGEAEELEAIRLLYVGATRAQDRLICAHRPGKVAWLEKLGTRGTALDVAVAEGTYELEDLGTTLRVEALRPGAVETEGVSSLLWLSRSGAETPRVPAALRPSDHGEDTDRTTPFRIVQLPGQHRLARAGDKKNIVALGNAVHAYLASLPSTRDVGETERWSVAERCWEAFGLSPAGKTRDLVLAGEEFTAWLESECGVKQWWTETPVFAPVVETDTASESEAARRQLRGTIDALVEAPDGTRWIIDHKTGVVSQSGLHVYGRQFVTQLEHYATALEGDAPTRLALHLPLSGCVLVVEDQG